jgi:hypothetical protein
VNVTFVESDDCSSVVVSVASCSTSHLRRLSNKYRINVHTRRPCWACQRPCLDNFLAWRQREISTLYAPTKERVRCISLGDRLKVPDNRFRPVRLVVNRRTSACARVHEGMRCGSVSNPNRSSAAAMNVASFTILDVLRVAFVTAAGFTGAGAAGPEAAAGADVGAGVPVRLGSPLTVRSLPCFSTIATGNSANLASSATGRRSLARA